MSKRREERKDKNKILYEGKRQKPSPLYVSLDNADTVIEGGSVKTDNPFRSANSKSHGGKQGAEPVPHNLNPNANQEK